MNKQAITFFSLFSLILVLSVYYMLIPPSSSKDGVLTTTITKLQDALSQKRQETTQASNEVVASEVSSSTEIDAALTTINETKKAENIETKVTQAISELGYSHVFCELEGSLLKITITKSDASKEDASIIMDKVLKVCDQKVIPEIKFIGE